MEIEWNSEAEKEFLQLPKNIQRGVKSCIEKLPEKGLNWDKVEYIGREDLDLEVFRLKINSEEVNHRVIFDVKDQKYIIYKVGRRPGFYEKESLSEVENRI